MKFIRDKNLNFYIFSNYVVHSFLTRKLGINRYSLLDAGFINLKNNEFTLFNKSETLDLTANNQIVIKNETMFLNAIDNDFDNPENYFLSNLDLFNNGIKVDAELSKLNHDDYGHVPTLKINVFDMKSLSLKQLSCINKINHSPKIYSLYHHI